MENNVTLQPVKNKVSVDSYKKTYYLCTYIQSL